MEYEIKRNDIGITAFTFQVPASYSKTGKYDYELASALLGRSEIMPRIFNHYQGTFKGIIVTITSWSSNSPSLPDEEKLLIMATEFIKEFQILLDKAFETQEIIIALQSCRKVGSHAG